MRAGLAAACAVALLGAAAHAAAPPAVRTIVMADMAFGPAPAGLKVGQTVEWVNRDIFQHTATARDRSFELDLKPNTRQRVVLKKAGRIEVYCRYHPGMKLILTVAP